MLKGPTEVFAKTKHASAEYFKAASRSNVRLQVDKLNLPKNCPILLNNFIIRTLLARARAQT
jgi:hypothetical protein